jgi:hypothetical protein
VFHPPPPGGHIQAGKLVAPRKDPPSGGRACTCLLEKVCAIALDRPPVTAYYAQTAGDSIGAPGGIVHFKELLAILFRQPGRYHHAKAGPVWLRRMPGHGGRPW